MDLTKAVLCLTLLFGLISGIESQILETNRTNLPNHGICYSMDIRNHPKNLERLRGCSVIIGSLQIVLMDGIHEYDNYTYPELKEITHYLVLYRVKSLTTLSKLFPNLSLIRGQRLFLNYALIIFDLPQLTEINLNSLTMIQRGCVRIEKNPQLCFSKTPDWASITNSEPGHQIYDNGNDNCPEPDVLCGVCTINYCWNQSECQKYPNVNCRKECFNGCTDDGRCHFCKNYSDNGMCVDSCPSRKYFVSATFECVTREFCNRMYKGRGWVFQDQCIKNCPIGYREERKENGLRTCIYCGSECNVPCYGSEVVSMEQVQAYRGCHFINGSLTIKLFGEFTHEDVVMAELEEGFGSVREIKGFLLVYRSTVLPSLSFFKNLSVIHGEELHNDLYAMAVEDMENLRTIWDFENKTVAIEKGKLYFHNNPVLCMSEIRKLANQTNITISEHEVCSTSNGNREACHIKTLNLEVLSVGENFAVIEWEQYIRKVQNVRMNRDVGYLIHFYRDAVEGETTHRYNTDDCSSRGWDYKFVAERSSDIPKMTFNLTNLSSYSTYAVYVQTYDKSENRHIEANSEEGESNMIFFKTKMDTPPMPTVLEAVSYQTDELTLFWAMPHKYVNPLNQYTVELYIDHDDQKSYDAMNYCDKEVVWKTPELGPSYNIDEDMYLIERDSQESCRCKDENWHKQMEIIREHYEKENAKKLNSEDVCNRPPRPGVTGTYDDFLRALTCGHIQVGGRTENDMQEENETIKRVKREIVRKNFDIRKLLDLDDSDLLKYPNKNFTLNGKFHIFAANFTGTAKNFTISNLKHYSKYIILMAGCTNEGGYRCSGTAVTTQRTRSEPTKDRVVNFRVTPLNASTMEVSWEKPVEPNGAVLYYVIQYKTRESEMAEIVSICVSNLLFYDRDGKFTVINLGPGEYFVRIKVATLGNFSDGTDWHKVYITESHTLVIICSVLGTIFVFGCVLSGLYWWFKKKEYDSRQEEARNLVPPPEVRPSTSVRYTVRRNYEDDDVNNPIQLYNPEDDEE